MNRPTDSSTHGRLTESMVVGGRYVIDGFLARGGFATVYRAHHLQIGRKLAIKVLEPPGRAAAAEAFQERFLQEARLAARIDHPGVVDVFDFGVLDDGRTFIAMDLLEGHDLEAELKIGPMAASRVVPLFVECLGALNEGHRQGIVHKDLKPSNLFVVKPGEPNERLVILDFGIARVFEDPGSRVTQDGGFSGTPAYLAPEYIRHQVVAPPVDVYQMGLILVEALTGAPAIHSDNSMGYLLAHCLQQVTLPRSLYDTKLGDVCLRAVRKDPRLRFRDAGEFRDALAAIDRDLLKDTLEMFVNADTAAIPQPDDGAKTLQFINLSESELAEISASVSPPDVVPTPTNNHAPPAFASHAQVEEVATSDRRGLWLGLVALLGVAAIATALAVIIGPPSEVEPAEQPPTPVAVVEPPVPVEPVVEPIAPAAVPADIGAPDAGASDVGAEAVEVVVEEPPPAPKPKPRPRPRPPRERPAPKKPAQPLLLSP